MRSIWLHIVYNRQFIWAGSLKGESSGLKIHGGWLDSTPAHHIWAGIQVGKEPASNSGARLVSRVYTSVDRCNSYPFPPI